MERCLSSQKGSLSLLLALGFTLFALAAGLGSLAYMKAKEDNFHAERRQAILNDITTSAASILLKQIASGQFRQSRQDYHTASYLPQPGDANGDGCADLFDVGTISDNWNHACNQTKTCTLAQGDLNGDHRVDVFDVGVASDYFKKCSPQVIESGGRGGEGSSGPNLGRPIDFLISNFDLSKEVLATISVCDQNSLSNEQVASIYQTGKLPIISSCKTIDLELTQIGVTSGDTPKLDLSLRTIPPKNSPRRQRNLASLARLNWQCHDKFSPAAFTDIYQIVLGRLPKSSEAEKLTQLALGKDAGGLEFSIQHLESLLRESNEYQTDRRGILGENITTAYRVNLGELPDLSLVQQYADSIAAGVSLRSIANTFIAQRGSLPLHHELTESLFKTLLGRPPTELEKTSFSQKFADGSMTVQQFQTEVRSGAGPLAKEYAENGAAGGERVNALYRTLFHRCPAGSNSPCLEDADRAKFPFPYVQKLGAQLDWVSDSMRATNEYFETGGCEINTPAPGCALVGAGLNVPKGKDQDIQIIPYGIFSEVELVASTGWQGEAIPSSEFSNGAPVVRKLSNPQENGTLFTKIRGPGGESECHLDYGVSDPAPPAPLACSVTSTKDQYTLGEESVMTLTFEGAPDSVEIHNPNGTVENHNGYYLHGGFSLTSYSPGSYTLSATVKKGPDEVTCSKTIEYASCNAPQSVGVDVVFVVDNSASNGGWDASDCPAMYDPSPNPNPGNLTACKDAGTCRCGSATARERAVLSVFDTLKAEASHTSQVSIVQFPTLADSDKGYAKSAWFAVGSTNRAVIETELFFTRRPTGSTPYASGLQGANEMLQALPSDPNRRRIVFFITDGMATDSDPFATNVLAEEVKSRATVVSVFNNALFSTPSYMNVWTGCYYFQRLRPSSSTTQCGNLWNSPIIVPNPTSLLNATERSATQQKIDFLLGKTTVDSYKTDRDNNGANCHPSPGVNVCVFEGWNYGGGDSLSLIERVASVVTGTRQFTSISSAENGTDNLIKNALDLKINSVLNACP